jgi:MADS-box transcription factor, plant
MMRTKREYKKIQNYQSLMVTFSKRRNGIMKKAYELGVLCKVDVALLVISPSGKVTPFSINSRFSFPYH